MKDRKLNKHDTNSYGVVYRFKLMQSSVIHFHFSKFSSITERFSTWFKQTVKCSVSRKLTQTMTRMMLVILIIQQLQIFFYVYNLFSLLKMTDLSLSQESRVTESLSFETAISLYRSYISVTFRRSWDKKLTAIRLFYHILRLKIKQVESNLSVCFKCY